MFDSILDFFQSAFDTVLGWFNSFVEFFDDFYISILVISFVIISFVVFTFFKRISLSFIITIQIEKVAVLITLVLSLVTFIATSFVTLYNKIFSFAEFIGSGASDLDCFGTFMSCAGLSDVMPIFFSELLTLFSAVLFIRVSFILLWFYGKISHEIWKLGVLLGLA